MLAAVSAAGCCGRQTQESQNDKFMEEKLNLTQEWDKVFPQSDKVRHSKVTFHNECLREAPGNRDERPLRSSEGAGVRALCTDIGGKGIPDHRI